MLFGALVFVVAGSLAGQWFGVMQKLGLVENFWLGHQGYEYVELGRLLANSSAYRFGALAIPYDSCFDSCFETKR